MTATFTVAAAGLPIRPVTAITDSMVLAGVAALERRDIPHLSDHARAIYTAMERARRE